MAYRKLNRRTGARKALFQDLVTDLFIHERIQTTEAKAKEIRSVADEMITLAKRGDLHARRQVAAFVRPELADATTGQDVVQKLFSQIAPRFASRTGGYTRMFKVGPRRGDGAPMVILELVE